jgi:adenylate cyclase class 2
VYFTLKRSVVGHLDSIEHETIVQDAKELEAIIKLMGYELYSDLTKIRQKAKHGEFEICLDEVPNLGTFIEVEKIMHHDADHDMVVDELWDFLQKLGVSKYDEQHEGYDVLERRQRGL